MSSHHNHVVTAPAKGLAVGLAAVSVSSLVSIGISLFLNWGR